MIALFVGVSVGDGGVVIAGHDAHADSGLAAESVWDGVGSAVWVLMLKTFGNFLDVTHGCILKTIRIRCITWIFSTQIQEK